MQKEEKEPWVGSKERTVLLSCFLSLAYKIEKTRSVQWETSESKRDHTNEQREPLEIGSEWKREERRKESKEQNLLAMNWMKCVCCVSNHMLTQNESSRPDHTGQIAIGFLVFSASFHSLTEQWLQQWAKEEAKEKEKEEEGERERKKGRAWNSVAMQLEMNFLSFFLLSLASSSRFLFRPVFLSPVTCS